MNPLTWQNPEQLFVAQVLKKIFYNSVAELRYMKDWIQKLDDFLKLSGKELLSHAGKISAELAKQKANTEYDKFKERTVYNLSPVEIHFLENFEKEHKKLNDR